MLESLRNKRILVVVAHPDDEVLGVGASMHRLIRECGCEVRAVILGEGVTSRSDQRDPGKWKRELDLHRSNIAAAAAAIGYQSHGTHDLPDNRFDSVALLDIVKVVEAEKRNFRPDIVFTHHAGDLNIDHRRTFEAVVTATRPMEGEQVKAIFSFETPSATEWQAPAAPSPFRPDFYISVSEADVQAKIKAMEGYELEKRPYPHPRSPRALEVLAEARGISVGAHRAEAFMLVRALAG